MVHRGPRPTSRVGPGGRNRRHTAAARLHGCVDLTGDSTNSRAALGPIFKVRSSIDTRRDERAHGPHAHGAYRRGNRRRRRGFTDLRTRVWPTELAHAPALRP